MYIEVIFHSDLNPLFRVYGNSGNKGKETSGLQPGRRKFQADKNKKQTVKLCKPL
jgi:hypothetical protein